MMSLEEAQNIFSTNEKKKQDSKKKRIKKLKVKVLAENKKRWCSDPSQWLRYKSSGPGGPKPSATDKSQDTLSWNIFRRKSFLIVLLRERRTN